MNEDRIDELMAQWRAARPDLDPTPMRTVGRLLRIATFLERRVEASLAPFDLSLWQFDVLVTLRRHDADLSPTQLSAATMLTSGAMTHRLDRLEEDGLVERRPDPVDRRGTRVVLTPAGRELADAAIAARFREAAEVESHLGGERAEQLAALLRELLLALEDDAGS